ncbi:hypothetical protein D3C87_2135090 [compost metagenome]
MYLPETLLGLLATDRSREDRIEDSQIDLVTEAGSSLCRGRGAFDHRVAGT